MEFIKNLYRDKEKWFIPALAPLFILIDKLLGEPLNYTEKLKQTEEMLKKQSSINKG